MVSTQYPAGRIVFDTIDSRLLANNAAGDPACRQLVVYLPPGYDKGAARYPSVCVLAGYGGRGGALMFAMRRPSDPVHIADRHVAALRSLRLLCLDAGTLDEFNLQYGARIFRQRLRSLEVPFVYEEFVDSHLNIPYRFDRSFRAISDALPGA